MTDYSIKQILVTFGIIFLVINSVGLIIIWFNINSVSNEVQKKLDNTNELLTKLNSNIQGLDKLNQNIGDIKSDISSINSLVSVLPNNTASITNVNSNLVEINTNLDALTKIYPPNQTLVINNMKQEELNKLINNAVNLEFSKISNKTTFNFILNIIFGTITLFSLGGLVFYFIFKKKESQ